MWLAKSCASLVLECRGKPRNHCKHMISMTGNLLCCVIWLHFAKTGRHVLCPSSSYPPQHGVCCIPLSMQGSHTFLTNLETILFALQGIPRREVMKQIEDNLSLLYRCGSQGTKDSSPQPGSPRQWQGAGATEAGAPVPQCKSSQSKLTSVLWVCTLIQILQVF